MPELEEVLLFLVSYIAVGVLTFSWIIRSGKKTVRPMSDLEGVKSHIAMLMWVVVLVSFVYVGGGFLAQQDAPWHQLTHSPGAIMPAMAVTFMVLYPAYFIVGGGAWLFARTRFDGALYNRNFKIAIFLATFAPFLFLPAQDPDAMGFSVDLINTVIRAGYGLMMFLWLSAVAYIVVQQGMAILTCFKKAGANVKEPLTWTPPVCKVKIDNKGSRCSLTSGLFVEFSPGLNDIRRQGPI